MVKEMIKTHPCKAGTHEDDDRFTLQIEMANEHAITVSFPKKRDGVSPSVVLWRGNDELDSDP